MDDKILEKIKQVKTGCKSSYQDVMLLYQDKIYEHCFRMLMDVHEAEDIAQETFIRAYINIHTFDEEKKFSTWLYRIATNLTIDRLRKRKPDYHLDAQVRGTDGLTMYSQLASSAFSVLDEVENMEIQRFIQREISALSPIYRQVIMLRYLEGFPLKDISVILDIPLGTVKTRIHRGREMLRKRLRHL